MTILINLKSWQQSNVNKSLKSGIVTWKSQKKKSLKNKARPGYWVPDFQVLACNCRNAEFKGSDTKHYCRATGMGVYSNCSGSRRPVASRHWDHPAWVCDQCPAKKGQL